MYLVSDILYFITCYIIRYRHKVVTRNLEIAFPEIPKESRKKIMKGFYRNFSDVLVESLMAISMKKEEMVRRVTFSNIDQLEDCKSRGLSSVFLATHQCNWEWMLMSGTVQFPYHIIGVYKPLKNKSMDELMISTRSRFGTEMIQTNRIVRNIAMHRKDVRGIGLIGDQRPRLGGKKLWHDMFGKPTAFFPGIEAVPKMENSAVFMARMVRVRRGHYHLDMIKLCEPPYSKNPESTEIISKYVDELESVIQENPSDWLWSHNRWKYSKEEAASYDRQYEKGKN